MLLNYLQGILIFIPFSTFVLYYLSYFIYLPTIGYNFEATIVDRMTTVHSQRPCLPGWVRKGVVEFYFIAEEFRSLTVIKKLFYHPGAESFRYFDANFSRMCMHMLCIITIHSWPTCVNLHNAICFRYSTTVNTQPFWFSEKQHSYASRPTCNCAISLFESLTRTHEIESPTHQRTNFHVVQAENLWRIAT